MKIISARQEKIARVNCSCCGEDEHFVDIFFNRNLDHKDSEEYLFEFVFDTKDDIYAFRPLKQRIRDSWNLLRNEDNYIRNESVDAILLDLEQVEEIYSVVREYAKKELNKKELAKIDNPKKPKVKRHYIKFKKQKNNDWVEIYFFRGGNGLTMFMDHYEDKKEPNKVLLNDFSIGWFIPESTPQKYVRMYAWNWLLKRSKSGMTHMSCSLTKSETIQFLSSLNYIFSNMVKKENEPPCITI